MSVKEVCDRLSFEGISYGVPKGASHVVVIAGGQSVHFDPAQHKPAHLDELVAQARALKV